MTGSFTPPEKLYWGKVQFIEGPVHETLGYLLCEAAVKQRLSKVLYIDCHNSFDSFFIQRRFKKERPQELLKNIMISRPFTIYQLRELVFKKLEDAINKFEAKVLLIPCIDGFREDRETPIILRKVMNRLYQITQRHGLITVISRYRRWE